MSLLLWPRNCMQRRTTAHTQIHQLKAWCICFQNTSAVCAPYWLATLDELSGQRHTVQSHTTESSYMVVLVSHRNGQARMPFYVLQQAYRVG